MDLNKQPSWKVAVVVLFLGFLIIVWIASISKAPRFAEEVENVPSASQLDRPTEQPAPMPTLQRWQIGETVKLQFGQHSKVDTALTPSDFGEFTRCFDRPGVIDCAAHLLDTNKIFHVPRGTKAQVLSFNKNPYRASVLQGDLVELRILEGVFRGKPMWTLEDRIARVAPTHLGGVVGPPPEKVTQQVAPRKASRRVEPQNPITMSKYYELESGIGLARTVAILGEYGEEMSRVDLGGTTTVMYRWQNPNGSNLIATFQNAVLVSKAQYGLR